MDLRPISELGFNSRARLATEKFDSEFTYPQWEGAA